MCFSRISSQDTYRGLRHESTIKTGNREKFFLCSNKLVLSNDCEQLIALTDIEIEL